MAAAFYDRDVATVTWVKYLFRATLATTVVVLSLWFWLLHTESGAAYAWGRLEVLMGGDLTAELMRGDLSNGIEIRNLHFTSSAVDLLVDSSRVAVGIDLVPLRINVDDVELMGVTLQTRKSESEAAASLDVESLLTGLRLPLQLDLISARVDEIDLSINGGEPLSIEYVEASLFWHDAINVRTLQVQRGGDFLTLRGDLDLVVPQSVDLGINATYQAIALQADVSGDAQALELQNLIVEGDAIEATASAIVRWVDGIRGSGHVNVSRLDPAAMTEVWPQAHSVAGSFGFEATPELVRVSDATLSIAGTDTSLQLDGGFELATSTVSADVGWSNFQWPIDAASPSVRSADGKVTLNGVLDNWQVGGRVAVGTEDMPDGRFMIHGGGDQDRIALVIDDGRVFGGSIAGEAAYSWRGDQAWSMNVGFDDLRTTHLVPDWPGVVSGAAAASGKLSPLVIDVTLQDVHGVIRGDPLTAAGSLAWSGNSATADELSITHGNTRLFLDGSVDTEEGLVFEAGVQIESYVDQMSGFVETSGRLSLVADEPYLSFDLNSAETHIGDVQISGVRIVDARAADAVAGFVLNVDEVQVAGQDISDIQIITSVRKDRQHIEVTGFNRDAKIGLSMVGAFDDWNSPAESPWRGDIASFFLDFQDGYGLRLGQPAAIELSTTKIAVEQFCVADDASSRLCVDFLRKALGHIDLRAALADVPVALVEHVVDTKAIFDQRLSGVLSWTGDPDSGATGRGDFRFSPGAITSSQTPSLSFVTGEGQLHFEITDGDLLSGTASLPLPGVGGIDANFNVLELTELATSDITGNINVAMTDIAPLALFSRAVDSASGVLHATLDVTGTLSKPLLVGSVVLQGGAVTYEPTGMNIDHIELLGELNKDRGVELSGTFRAGEGRGEIFSSADYRDTADPGIRFKIRGEDLLLVDLPDIHLTAQPDIEIAYSKNLLNINGSLLIPKARITPSNLAENKVSESDDVVIVGGQLPETVKEEQAKSDLKFDGNVEIELGKDVIVELSIAKASLSGSAVFDWQGDSIPIVDGRYDLVGSIQAFGQVLDIAEGGIRFANVPVNQPYLRIRAEREIYGNSQVKTAGVLVDGVASDPTIEAYTNPHTTEERALTLLVTGSDFDYEQGVGAVDFGTYIAPRLFVSYGIGIFDRENVISARYDLSKGFGVKASSGEKQSGVDLNYRLEN